MKLVRTISMLHIQGKMVSQTLIQELDDLTIGINLTVGTRKDGRTSGVVEYLHACWIKSLASEAISCLETR